ncbi:hypothetical protein LY76DRAFT_528787, partial [Colletotrichum caudatum]
SFASYSSGKAISNAAAVAIPSSKLVHHRSCVFQSWLCQDPPSNFNAQPRATSYLSNKDLSAPALESGPGFPKFAKAKMLKMECRREPAEREASRCVAPPKHCRCPAATQQRASKHHPNSKRVLQSRLAFGKQCQPLEFP